MPFLKKRFYRPPAFQPLIPAKGVSYPAVQWYKIKKALQRRAEIIFNPPGLAKSFYFFPNLSSDTVSFTRPFLRRLAKTLRPLAVCMRWRNPCTCFLLRTWGWYVLFLPGIVLCFSFYKNYLNNHLLTPGHHPCCLWKDGEGSKKFTKYRTVLKLNFAVWG